jgi:hypothetical protein
MNIQQVGLLVLMVIGGIAVLGSYVFGAWCKATTLPINNV